jgi:hypothetical protein
MVAYTTFFDNLKRKYNFEDLFISGMIIIIIIRL